MIDVILPYRAANESRTLGLNVCLHAWDHATSPVRVLVGGDGAMSAPFNKARAVNRLVRSSNADKILLYGSDHLPPSDEKLADISAALEHFAWVGCFSRHATLTQRAVDRIWGVMQEDRWPQRITGADVDAVAPFALGVIAVRRDAWDEIGGLDERFHGWGGEDLAIRETLVALYGNHTLNGTVYSTPHPAADRSHAQRNMTFVAEYRQAISEGRLREYLDETVTERAGQIPAS